MRPVNKYRAAASVLVLVVFVAAYCFYKLVANGLSSPAQAKFWAVLLFATLCCGLIACLVFYYYRIKLSHAPNDEIAMQALAAAGRQVARDAQQQAADATAKNANPKQLNRPRRS